MKTAIKETKESLIHLHPAVTWELLPANHRLPKDPVDNLIHPLIAAALLEILALAGLITSEMLIASDFAICATVNGKIVYKGPDWVFIPFILEKYRNKILRSYTPHKQGEKPAIVLEVLPDWDSGEYSMEARFPYGKMYFYEQIIEVPIYMIFDPTKGELEFRQLDRGQYQLRSANQNGHYWIETLGLYIGTWHGTKHGLTTHWLRWWDKDGNLLPWSAEKVAQSFVQGLEQGHQEGLEQGRQEGLEQGHQQGQQELVLKILAHKFGKIKPNLQKKIKSLSITNLDELAVDLLDFESVDNLSAWLQKH